jgi:hypothetical protein
MSPERNRKSKRKEKPKPSRVGIIWTAWFTLRSHGPNWSKLGDIEFAKNVFTIIDE